MASSQYVDGPYQTVGKTLSSDEALLICAIATDVRGPGGCMWASGSSFKDYGTVYWTKNREFKSIGLDISATICS